MLPLIIILGLICRLLGINQSLWLDEAAQAVMSRNNLVSIWIGNIDFHPPLFHTLLHFWMLIFQAEWWMRLLPVCFGLGSISLLFHIGRKLFNERVGLISAFLLAVAPYHVYYSQELRSYSMLVFVVLASFNLFLDRRWREFSCSIVVGIFTNYVFVFYLLGLGIYVATVDWKPWKNFLLSHLPTAFCFCLWLPQFINQLKAGQNLLFALPAWKTLSSLNVFLGMPFTLLKLIVGRIDLTWDAINLFYVTLILVSLGFPFVKTFALKSSKSKLLKILIFTPLCSAWFISFVIPLNNPSRLIFILPFMLLVVAFYIDRFRDEHLIFIFAVISFFGIIWQNLLPINRREDWRQAVKFVENQATAKFSPLALFVFPDPFAGWQWYSSKKAASLGVGIKTDLVRATQGQKQIFLFDYLADLTDPNRQVKSKLEKMGYQTTAQYSFNNLGFIFEMRKLVL